MKSKRAPRLTGSAQNLFELLSANRRGKGTGIYSICSANRFVLEAGMLQAAKDKSLLLIESTSNQVNQFGGYTGQTPAEFAKFVHEVAAELKFPQKQILLGGDHLGPHVWRSVRASAAMEKAREMVGAYVRAGFRKIHLDASMPCADDKIASGHSLPDEVVSERAAELCVAAEEAYRSLSGSTSPPVYVVGTEVPIPGGEQLGAKAPEVTSTKDLAHTLEVTEKTFHKIGLSSAWERVIAVVVQPGVEFGDSTVFPYDAKKAKTLSQFVLRKWNGVYEAHSTDYQSRKALRQMVLDHFAILKVGPWLTFSFARRYSLWQQLKKNCSLSRQALPSQACRRYWKPQCWKTQSTGKAITMGPSTNCKSPENIVSATDPAITGLSHWRPAHLTNFNKT